MRVGFNAALTDPQLGHGAGLVGFLKAGVRVMVKC